MSPADTLAYYLTYYQKPNNILNHLLSQVGALNTTLMHKALDTNNFDLINKLYAGDTDSLHYYFNKFQYVKLDLNIFKLLSTPHTDLSKLVPGYYKSYAAEKDVLEFMLSKSQSTIADDILQRCLAGGTEPIIALHHYISLDFKPKYYISYNMIKYWESICVALEHRKICQERQTLTDAVPTTGSTSAFKI